MEVQKNMNISKKLAILSDAAKYDVSCTSSGVDKKNEGAGMGDAHACGICHSFASDGRCISLLKILMTNECIYDCLYCINRKSNDVERATFTPEEICQLTIEFYRRNYIEGLFLSSGILKDPDYTMSLMYETLLLLRHKYHFNGYIHIKAIPGASSELIERIGFLADRMSVNLELPTREGMERLAPNKHHKNILAPMKQISQNIGRLPDSSSMGYLPSPTKSAKPARFVPAGQSTQMIVGATPETDMQLMSVSEYMYKTFKMKRVFFSSFIDVNHNISLPASSTPPLLREHRLYQADWLLRFYGFKAGELFSTNRQNLLTNIDPKCTWAVEHPEHFPVDVMRADYYSLLRVPGIGVKSAKRILRARKYSILDTLSLKKMGVVMKRAKYFITCEGNDISLLSKDQAELIAALSDNKESCYAENKTQRQLTINDFAVMS